MIGFAIDRVIGMFSPSAGLRRTQQRRALERAYQGAEANRLTNNKKPRNLSADSEMLGPFGADSMRAWARNLVRDNAYAWGVVDTIVSSVVGCGITAQSQFETAEGTDIENVNEVRDKVWQDWCEVCDVNGKLNFHEIQQLCQREMVEAGEVLIHLVRTPSEKYRGILRPVPLALEIIEADRLALEKDTYKIHRSGTGNKIIRGVEIDDLGKPVAYWVYPEHPNGPYSTRVLPERFDASEFIHLYRMDRIGQSRGVSWFAPVMSWLRDLGVYVDNEIQASAVASCFGVAITTNGRAGSGLMPSTDSEQTDVNGNSFEYLEPAMVVRLQPGESVESINPGRPNSASEPWINLMLRGISVGTGLSYEVVSRNYSGTSYSSSRTSMLEDRRRFRRWQKYMVEHMCQPIWDAFCEQAATSGVDGFASMTEILEDRRTFTAVEWQTPAWEWVDPQSEQAASDAALTSFQSTYQDELGQRGKNWRNVFYQRAKEEKLKRQLGLVTADMAQVESTQAEAQQMAASSAAPNADTTAQQPAGEMADMSRLQWGRNRKAIEDILAEYISGTASETKARVFLQSLGLTEATANTLLQDASDGTVDTDLDTLPEPEPVSRKVKRSDEYKRDKDGQFASTGSGGGGEKSDEPKKKESGSDAEKPRFKPRQKQIAAVIDKHTAAVSKLKETHQSKVSALTEKHNAEVQSMRAGFDKQSSALKEQLDALDKKQGDELDELGKRHKDSEEKAGPEGSPERLKQEAENQKERDKVEAAMDKETAKLQSQKDAIDNKADSLESRMEEKLNGKIEALNDSLESKVSEIEDKSEDALMEHHEAEKDDLGSTHDKELEDALNRDAGDDELQALDQKHNSELATLQARHATELSRLKQAKY